MAAVASERAMLHMPKIQTDSKSDILFVRQQLHDFSSSYMASSREKVLSYRTRGGNFSERREAHFIERVGAVMDEWLDNTFALAASNLEVNGMSYDDAMKAEDEYEAVDERLEQELERLKKEKIALLSDVIDKRRQMPSQLENLVDETVTRQYAHAYESDQELLNAHLDDADINNDTDNSSASDNEEGDNMQQHTEKSLHALLVQAAADQLEQGYLLAQQLSQKLDNSIVSLQKLNRTIQNPL